jgi:allantoate deiminase
MISTDALAREIMDRLDRLAAISEAPDRLTRRCLTPQHAAANAAVAGWMRQAGMTARIDAIGNVVGRYEGAAPGAPALLLGSHLDTVIDAGRYDGMLGVVLAISCVGALKAEGRRFPFAIEIIGFADEEGVRFQSTYLGSRAVAGDFDSALLARRDADGVTLAAALAAFGLDPALVGAAARRADEFLAYVEIHIEQGPVLERLGCALGVVSAIAGATRLETVVDGEAGHAGTVPMDHRRDALAAAAEMVIAVETICRASAGTPGTVGQLAVSPGAVNVIPGRVRFTVDLRAPADDDRRRILAEVRREFSSIAARRIVRFEIRETHDAPSVPFAATLMDEIAAAAATLGYDLPRLASGAGHDAAAMSALTETGMLFVRCKGGISHNPAEAVATDDVAAAAAVLIAFVENFDRKGPADHPG